MYLHRRSYSCSGSPGVVPHLMLELTELADERCEVDLELWRGVTGVSDLEFRWVAIGPDLDDLYRGLARLRGDRRIATLLDELRHAGWDGRSVDETSIVETNEHCCSTWHRGLFIEDQHASIIGPSLPVATAWLRRLAEVRSGAGSDVILRDLWSPQPMLHIIRAGADLSSFVEDDRSRHQTSGWSEAVRGASRHVDFNRSATVVWRRLH